METIKEKAYDKDIRVARSKIKNNKDHVLYEEDIIDIFPELKESEGERIRKEFLDFCKNRAENYSNDPKYKNISSWIAWLEKQGKRNPIDKVESKFKTGDWIIQENIGVYKVIEICESWYEVVDNNGKHYSIGFDKEYMCRPWTIQDAKDGDILVCPKYAGDIIPNIFIFKDITIKDNDVYCHCSFSKAFIGTVCYIANADSINTDFYPATKEQRDILLKAMDDTGYTFDFEKKELKQKPDWNEEDKNFMYDTLSNLTELKDRYGEEYGNVGKCIEWVKSIRPQKQWKPTNDQIVALEHFVRSIWESEFASPYNNNIKLVYLLLKQLKELK